MKRFDVKKHQVGDNVCAVYTVLGKHVYRNAIIEKIGLFTIKVTILAGDEWDIPIQVAYNRKGQDKDTGLSFLIPLTLHVQCKINETGAIA